MPQPDRPDRQAATSLDAALPTGGPHPGAMPFHRPLWWSTFLLFAAAISLWTLAMPTLASPDEPAHVIKAAAVARGQLLGRDVHTPTGDTITYVQVPAALAQQEPCYAHRPKLTPACQRPVNSSTELVSAGTAAGHYQPLYYALVGMGSLLFPGPAGLYVMRLFSALLSAIFLASALQSARRWRSGLGPLGVAVAVTPMTYFLAAGVNPSGLEITAALATWASLLALLAAPLQADRRLIVRVVVAASALVLSRGLSPLWLLVIGVTVVLCCGLPALRDAVRRPDVRVAMAVVLLCTLAAAAWIVSAGALTLRPSRRRRPLALPDILAQMQDRFWPRTRQMVGNLGWLDTTFPAWLYTAWAALLVLLLLAFLATSGFRRIVALMVLLVAVVALPAAIEASQHDVLGFVWQGRYTMPLAVGLPLVLAYGIDQRWPRFGSGVKNAAAALLIGVILVAQVTAFWVNLHRYTVGVGNPGGLLHVTWSPPVAAPQLLVTYAAVQVALAVVLVVSSRGQRPQHDLR